MNYDDILNIKDVSERQEKFKEFYINDIGINDWLCNTDNQSIDFVDRIEYKKDNKYHRLEGPAIAYKDDEKNSRGIYYIYGELMTEEVWKANANQILRKLKLDSF